jgi:pimeloyl-ACP methyl ester carboxylesterase
LNDPCDPNFAVEAAYKEGKTVYSRLQADENIRIIWRQGQHHGFERIQNYFDWYDAVFQRQGQTMANFPEVFLHNFSWEVWAAGRTEPPFPTQGTASEQIQWTLGQASGLAWSPGGGYGTDVYAYVQQMYDEGTWRIQTTSCLHLVPSYLISDLLLSGISLVDVEDGVNQLTVNFGNYIHGTVYYIKPSNADNPPMPAVVWLHPYSYQRGYTEDYTRSSTRAYHALAKAGYLVLTYHQFGFGHRVQDKANFYTRTPDSSIMNQLVQDVFSAIDFLAAPFNGSHPDGLSIKDQFGFWYPEVDAQRIFVAGYSMGGIVASYSCSLDPRCAGAAILAALSPLRNNTLAITQGGLWTLYEQHALQPVLGYYVNRSTELPIDYDVVLKAIAPRPCLVLNREQDRTVNQPAITSMMHNLGNLPGLVYQTQDSSSKLDDGMLEAMVAFLNASV